MDAEQPRIKRLPTLRIFPWLALKLPRNKEPIMNILVVGSGGREHALAWKLAQSPKAGTIYVAPGNAGTAIDAQNVDIAVDDIAALIEFAQANSVELTVVGPEVPLVAGIVDAFKAKGLRIFGPSGPAAELEGSKAFCKQILQDAGIPTAAFATFDNPDEAIDYLDQQPEYEPIVVKADGLAAGKGVYVCKNRKEAIQAVEEIGRDKIFGEAGDRIIIEECLNGQEASVLAITDGNVIIPLQPAQDHKPALDGDKGPNTGGMGAYCPAPLVDEQMMNWIVEKVLVPTVHQMKRAGCPFSGVLYAGLMITPGGPKVLEYNVRFGDPEAQPLLMRLQSDLLEILVAAADCKLEEIEPLKWDPRPAVCVVMASEGYPGSYEKGHFITGLEEADQLEDVKVFHAGTSVTSGGQVANSGGRVLGVTGLGDTIPGAKLAAYTAVKLIRWRGAWCRKDISDKAIE